MRELVDGIHHWTAHHEGIGADVSSYYVESAAAAIDPMEPADGLDSFAGRPLERVVLSNRHHYRHADRFHERFEVPVLVNERGLHEVEGRSGVETYSFGEEVAPGIVVHGVDESWPDEGVVHVAVGPGALVIADGAMNYGGIGFVPDQYLGEDPEAAKTMLRGAYARLVDELDFDAVLFAHGEPIAAGGREALRAFAAG